MKIIKSTEVPTTTWSGGTTTELFIYPEGSSFPKGDFQLRISIATVEKDNSTFTPLDGTERTLLVLIGNQLLQHREAHTADLQAGQQDVFSGSWITDCQGKATNFNVMTKGDVKATVTFRSFNSGDTFRIISDEIALIYIHHGSVSIAEQHVQKNHGIVPSENSKMSFQEHSEIVLVHYPRK